MSLRLYTPEGDIPFRQFTFPDGQPHFELQARPDFDLVTVEAAIRNPTELLQVLLARDALRGIGKAANLDIRYLMGARMDRRIDPFHCATLSVICKMIQAAGFSRIRILDPHSNAALAYLQAYPVYPHKALKIVLDQQTPNTWILAPDAGSKERVAAMLKPFPKRTFGILQGAKVRDVMTGELSGFTIPVHPDLKGADVLILDDICDGGRTFVGMAEVLHGLGVANVDLFVTHGIFSRGLPLNGIRKVWTTDSYTNPLLTVEESEHLRVIPIRMQDEQ